MPYNIKKKGSEYCVYNSDTGDSKGCSDSRGAAIKHMRALYANAGDKSKAYHPDASYLNSYISYLNGLIDSAQYSFMYQDNEHEELVSFSESLIDTCTDGLEKLIRWRDQWYGSAEDFKQAELKEQAKEAFTQSIVDRVKAEIGWTSGPKSFVATKQADGRVRVFMRVSNMYKDRHGEIITSAAHKEYEAYVAESQDYPEFWLWHTPGSKWGKADLVSFDDGFLTVSGLADPGYEGVALALAEQKDLGVSHGFKGIKLQPDGSYIDWYRMKEASPLPRLEAANIWTSFLLAKEKGMALQDKHKKFFDAIGVPAELVAQWDSQNKDVDAALKAAGVEFKEAGMVEVEVTLPTGVKTKAMVPASMVKTEPAPEPKPEPEPKPDEPVTATLADGTTIQLPASVVEEHKQAGSEMGQVLTLLKGLDGRLKALEERDPVADAMEAAIKQGKGFTASKEGEPPSESERKAQADWDEELANLLAPVGGSN